MAGPEVMLKIFELGYNLLDILKILSFIDLATPEFLNFGATINPELETKRPPSQVSR
jgi:hypothetical protein